VPEALPFTRFNDGGCDSEGRFFAGTIQNAEKGIPGKLYRYDPATQACDVVDEGPFTASEAYFMTTLDSFFDYRIPMVLVGVPMRKRCKLKFLLNFSRSCPTPDLQLFYRLLGEQHFCV